APEAFRAWPPAGARPVAVEGLYERVTDHGYGYGPAFRGLRRAWSLGERVFAEVDLPGGEADPAVALHPALLDAARHVLVTGVGAGEEPVRTALPFSWTGVRVLGAGATALRVELARVGEDAWSLHATDAGDRPVLAAESLTTRAVDAAGLRG